MKVVLILYRTFFYDLTIYNNKLYILDAASKKLVIYSISGTADTDFILGSNESEPRGVTTYNNKFYIADLLNDKVYIYDEDEIP